MISVKDSKLHSFSIPLLVDINIGDNSSDFIDIMHTQEKLDKSINFLNTSGFNFSESIDIDEEFKNDPVLLKKIKKNLDVKENMENILYNKINYFSFKKYSLDKQISDDQSILSIIDIGKERINELHGPLPEPKGHNHKHHKH